MDWRTSLLPLRVSEPTVRLHTRNAKGVFNAAVPFVAAALCRFHAESFPL